MLRRLHDADGLVQEERQGASQEVAVGDEVRVEDGDEVTGADPQAIVHVAGLGMGIVAARHMDRAPPFTKGPEQVAPSVVEHIDPELVFRIVERQRADDRSFHHVERFVIGWYEDVYARQFALRPREERPRKLVRLDAAVDIAAHQNEEQHDLGEGEELDDENEPDPIEIGAIIRIRENRFGETPNHVAQCHGRDESTGNRPRPALMTRPV